MFAPLTHIAFAAIISATSAKSLGIRPDVAETDPPARDTGCTLLSTALSTKVFSPNSTVYAYENSAEKFWSNVEILAPLCVFRPESARDVALALTLLKDTTGSFAVRGGGHMGIAGANNINHGVLMVMSNLTTLHLSSDQSVLSLGPAYDWGQVYKYLAHYNLTVPGGRLSPVGVPGLLLAGGINFYGNQRGWSADNIVSYEVVLASGRIVDASPDSHPDLFWALKGGSSNFGIVTRFDIRTLPSRQVWAGIYSVAHEDLPAFLAAIAAYAANITDPLSHIIPASIAVGRDPVTATGAAILFYDSDTVSTPECFKPFFAIPSVASTMAFKTLAEFADETGTAVVSGINDIFAAGTLIATTEEEILAGVNITNTIFYERLPLLYSQVPAANISMTEIDWQPIGKLWMDATAAAGGNALGLDPSKIYIAWAEVVEWIGADYDATCLDWVRATTAAIQAATQAAGLYSSFTYMGDAASFQTDGFYAGYGAVNQAELLRISRKYDPSRLFQTLMPGGFKIGA
ncbi:putative fad binding domain-containing protein [Diplocarpon rosae]|nr:putative fad binding domain-containing protein [Diplocarpon rosae]